MFVDVIAGLGTQAMTIEYVPISTNAYERIYAVTILSS